MDKSDEIYVSASYKLSDYMKLNFTINSSEKVWKEVIDIFIDRINSRFFDAIEKLSSNGEMQKYAFSIMTIECLLIDTFVKFRYGPNDYENVSQREYIKDSFKKIRYNKENKNKFIKFLTEFFPTDFYNKTMAEKFYINIRCGIIHFGSTETSSRLTSHSEKLVTLLDNGDISVDILVMQQKLIQYFKKYIQEIENRNEIRLREYFIIGMNYIFDNL